MNPQGGRLSGLAAGWVTLFYCACAAGAGLQVEPLGPLIIDRQRDYAEVQLLKLELPWQPTTSAVPDPQVTISDPGGRIYNGHSGATRLPIQLRLPGGSGIVELRSVADFGNQALGAERLSLLQISHAGRQRTLRLRHWQDTDRNGRIDWLEARVDDILAAARRSPVMALREAATAVTNWHETTDVDCGGVLPQLPTVILISPMCVNQLGVNVHRLDLDRELTATVLHEAHHAWAYRQLRLRGGEDGLASIYGAMLDCLFHGGGDCRAGLRPDAAFMHEQEAQAEAFAQRHKFEVSTAGSR